MSIATCPHPLKVRYSSEEAALEARLEFKRPSVRRKKLRAYFCPCGAWHLTKKPLTTCENCERCTWNPGPDCGRADHAHCSRCGHCQGRHS